MPIGNHNAFPLQPAGRPWRATVLCVLLLAAAAPSAFSQGDGATSATAARYDALVREGEGLLDRERLDEARAKWLEAAALAPKETRPLLLVARSYEYENLYEEAVAALKKAADLAPTDGDIHRRIALGLRRSEGDEPAIAYLREIRREFPDHVPILETLGFVLLDTKRYDEAAAAYRSLIEMSPEPTYYEKLIESHARQAKPAQAEAVFGEMTEIVQNSNRTNERKRREMQRLWGRYARILQTSGLPAPRPLDAVASPEEPSPGLDAKETSPTAIRASRLNAQGNLHLQQGYGALALSEHLEAAYLAGNADPLVNQAQALFRSRRESDALLYFRAVIDHFPEHAKAVLLIDQVVQAQRRQYFREHFNPLQAARFRLGEEACRRLARSDIPQVVKIQVEIYAIYYHYAPLPRRPELGLEARSRYAALAARPELLPREKKQIEGLIEEIDKWIAALESPKESAK